MQIISKKVMADYWTKIPAAKLELEAWLAEAKTADWATPADIRVKYGNASILKGGRVVFNIFGNKHRLVVWINYDYHTSLRSTLWQTPPEPGHDSQHSERAGHPGGGSSSGAWDETATEEI